ncbi:MAG: HNH endonuclease [Gammaproteobacteria bacterium]|nr:HNH endonuclease [Gammaproteobacteria bacterium]
MNQRLQQLILSNIIKDETSGCWLWQGQISNSGYGKLMIHDETNRTKTEGAQEVSYMAFIEPVTRGMIVQHNCNNRLCVNPEHLILHKI